MSEYISVLGITLEVPKNKPWNAGPHCPYCGKKTHACDLCTPWGSESMACPSCFMRITLDWKEPKPMPDDGFYAWTRQDGVVIYYKVEDGVSYSIISDPWGSSYTTKSPMPPTAIPVRKLSVYKMLVSRTIEEIQMAVTELKEYKGTGDDDDDEYEFLEYVTEAQESIQTLIDHIQPEIS